MNTSEEEFSAFLAPGFEADELPELTPLLHARPMLGAFITLFRGSEAEVMLRLIVLRELGSETQAPRLTPEALRNRFAYIEPIKLETALKRLRDNMLLVFEQDDGLYHLSDLGRNAVAALSVLFQFSAQEDGELGYLTAQLAGLSATGQLTAESLNHLLSKLNDLAWHFEEAIASGSEFHILSARRRLSANLRWLEKGTHILRALLADPEVPFELARVAQRIGLAQSRLARVDAAFQRALNKIETQRVTLGTSGISSSDVARWLRTRDLSSLAALANDLVAPTSSPYFLAGPHELLDRAEAVLCDTVRSQEVLESLPQMQDTPQTQAPPSEDLRELIHFNARVSALTGQTELAELVGGGGFAAASYRFSLLALLAESPAARMEGPIGDWMAQPFDVVFETHQVPVIDQEDLAAISAGYVQKRTVDKALSPDPTLQENIDHGI